jgi:predicted AAA+ superfamily ATPase
MNISRRKVRKYTELSLKYHLITAVGPFVQDTQVELSRHVKVYFSDLSYYSTILGVAYGHGFSKK